MKKTIEVVAAVIVKDDLIFVAQRGYGEFKGKWEFPGGKIEIGESHEQTLKREIKEELNVDINIKKFIMTVNHEYNDFYLIMHCYMCDLILGSLELIEHLSKKWLHIDELYKIDLLPADRKIITYLGLNKMLDEKT